MSYDKDEYEEDIKGNFYAESPSCERCGSNKLELAHIDYERTDGFTEALFHCKICGNGRKAKFTHPAL